MDIRYSQLVCNTRLQQFWTLEKLNYVNIVAKKPRDIRQLLIIVEESIVSNGLILNCNMSTHMFAKKDYFTVSILKESNYFIL